MYQKTKRIKNGDHLKFIRTLDCCKCGQPYPEACHIRAGTDGGMGRKPSDCWVVPMCSSCHRYQHSIPEREFWGKDLERAKRLSKDLYDNTGNYPKCRMLVILFYQGE